MGPLGVPELAIIVIIFGIGKLPEVGSALGKGIKEFKSESGVTDDRDVKLGTGTSEEPTVPTGSSDSTPHAERREVRADDI